MLEGGKFGGVEALTPRVSYASDHPWVVDVNFLEKILVGLTDNDAVPPSGGTITSWWLPFVHFPLCVRGKPRTNWSGQERLAPLSKVLLGT
jgi:hypothetical protein